MIGLEIDDSGSRIGGRPAPSPVRRAASNHLSDIINPQSIINEAITRSSIQRLLIKISL
jgi:hypothetical protein